MKRETLTFLMLVLAMVNPLWAQKVYVDFDRSVDFDSYKTFKWKQPSEASLEGESPFIDRTIKVAIFDELNEEQRARLAELHDGLSAALGNTSGDIISLAICAVIAGADGWEEIEDFGHDKFDWLKKFLRLPNGIPSHDTISRLFRKIKPRYFKKAS